MSRGAAAIRSRSDNETQGSSSTFGSRPEFPLVSGVAAVAAPSGRTQLPEPGQRLGQDLFFLAERKANLELPGIGVVIENDTGNRHDAGRERQRPAELQPPDNPDWPHVPPH